MVDDTLEWKRNDHNHSNHNHSNSNHSNHNHSNSNHNYNNHSYNNNNHSYRITERLSRPSTLHSEQQEQQHGQTLSQLQPQPHNTLQATTSTTTSRLHSDALNETHLSTDTTKTTTTFTSTSTATATATAIATAIAATSRPTSGHGRPYTGSAIPEMADWEKYQPAQKRSYLINERAKFESAISDVERRMDAGDDQEDDEDGEEEDDPLDIYHKYVQWVEEYYVEGDSKMSGLSSLLERATKRFEDDPRYKNDPRYLKLWMGYVKYAVHPLQIFQHLQKKGIGRDLALFYEELASFYENRGDSFDLADSMFQLGIERHAAPMARLKRKYMNFQKRMVQHLASQAEKKHVQSDDDDTPMPPTDTTYTAPSRQRSSSANPPPIRSTTPVDRAFVGSAMQATTFAQSRKRVPLGTVYLAGSSADPPPHMASRSRARSLPGRPATAAAAEPVHTLSKSGGGFTQLSDASQPASEDTRFPSRDSDSSSPSGIDQLIKLKAEAMSIKDLAVKSAVSAALRPAPSSSMYSQPKPKNSAIFEDSTATPEVYEKPPSEPASTPVTIAAPPIVTNTLEKKGYSEELLLEDGHMTTFEEVRAKQKFEHFPGKDYVSLMKVTSCASSPSKSLASPEDSSESDGEDMEEATQQFPPLAVSGGVWAGFQETQHTSEPPILHDSDDSDDSDYSDDEVTGYLVNEPSVTILNFSEPTVHTSAALRDMNSIMNAAVKDSNSAAFEDDSESSSGEEETWGVGRTSGAVDCVPRPRSRSPSPFRIMGDVTIQREEQRAACGIVDIDRKAMEEAISSRDIRSCPPSSDITMQIKNLRIHATEMPKTVVTAKSYPDPFSILVQTTFLDSIQPPMSKFPGYHVHCGISRSRSQQELDIDFGGHGKQSFKILKQIGKGGFAKVFLVNDLTELKSVQADWDAVDEMPAMDFLFALKVQTPASAWEYYMLHQAHQRLNLAQAVSVVQPRSFFASHQESLLVLEYCENGSLLDALNVLKKSGKSMEEVVILFYVRELLAVVNSLHQHDIIHGDLKADNVLLRMDDLSADDGLSSSWVPTFQPDGSGGWKGKGITLIDFGRGIDLRLFPDPHPLLFKTNLSKRADEQDCTQIQQGEPWSFHIDYYGIAGIAHTLLFNKYMDTVTVTVDSLDDLPEEVKALIPLDRQRSLLTRRNSQFQFYKLASPIKRYWQVDFWRKFFAVMLNPLGPRILSDSSDTPSSSSPRTRVECTAVESANSLSTLPLDLTPYRQAIDVLLVERSTQRWNGLQSLLKSLVVMLCEHK